MMTMSPQNGPQLRTVRALLVRALPVALALIVASLSAGCGALQRAGGKNGRCTILTTNDSEAHFDGERVQLDPLRYAGTIARIAARKKALLAEQPGGVLLVSAGDVLQGRYMDRSDADRSRAAKESWQVYEAAGYDLGTLGNHEFDAGPAVLRDALLGLSRYRMVVSNLANDSPTLDNRDGKLWDETVVRSCGGLKIGFFGLLTPSTRSISQFGDTKFRDADDPIVPAAKRAIAALRAQNVDLVVGLTHLGVQGDVALAPKLEGVDVLIGGHSHTLLTKVKTVGTTWIVQSGQRFSHVGELTLVATPATPGGTQRALDRDESSWRVVEVDASMAEDQATAAKIEALRAGYVREQVIGKRSMPWALRGWQRKFYGKRVARALWRYAGAHNAAGKPIDAAILNSGGLRSAQIYPPGPVTNFEVRAIHPFGNRLVVVQLDGETLRDVLEHACTGGHRGSAGERIEVWGLSFRCDTSKPGVRYAMVDGRAGAITVRGQRVADAMVGGSAMVPSATYRIAVNDYLARGGSGFTVFARGDRSCVDGTSFDADACKSSPTIAAIVEAWVRDESFDEPVPE